MTPRILVVIFLFDALFFCEACASEQIKRHVLGVWSSRYSDDLVHEALHRRVEFVLNHMGVMVDYIDLDQDALPDPATKEFQNKYLGVATYFERNDLNLENPKKWISWLEKLSQVSVPYVLFGYPAIDFHDGKTPARAVYLKLGLELIDSPESLIGLKFGVKKNLYLGFERKLNDVIDEYPPFVSQDRQVTRILTIKAPQGKSADAVFIGKKLSMAFGTFSITQERPGAGLRMWVIDPYLFLKNALSIRTDVPVPDVSVLNGNRVFYSHIDGDGFNSQSILNPSQYCGEVILEKVLKKYPMLPVGVSFIAAEINPQIIGNKRLHEIARRVAGLKNVELGSHTYYHPLHWGVLAKAEFSYRPPENKLDLQKEVAGSADYINTLSATKKVMTMQWSGDCVPGRDAVKKAAGAGLLNINGGDSIFDSDRPSISFLAPMGRNWPSAGNEDENFQVYSSNANDNIYTNGWKGAYFGFRKVIETFERTGSDRILKPVNLYYHFYSGERNVSLAALGQVFDWVSKQPLSHVFPSEYIKTVQGYRGAKIKEKDGHTFEISNAAGLKTLRIDATNGLSGTKVPRLAESKNVIGYKMMNGSLYIFLGDEPDTLLKLGTANNRMGIESVGGALKHVKQEPAKMTFTVPAFTRGALVIADIKNANRAVLKLSPTVLESTVRNGKAGFEFPPTTTDRECEVTLK